MPLRTAQIALLVDAVAGAIRDHADEVGALDQEIGDGDHVINLQRGLAALAVLAPDLDGLDWSGAFQKIGMSLMSTVGGAAGSLYGTFFIALSKAFRDREMSSPAMAAAFAAGVKSMQQRGKAGLGEKTMLDVLIPVSGVLADAAANAWELAEVLERMDQAAAAGCEATRDLLATKGRASFLGERARGHLDPGARTAQLMLGAIGRVLLENPG
jgi:dihydroxyacetone kinase-like protein